MPELSRFYWIVIKMFYNDHNPPHRSASINGNRATAIESGSERCDDAILKDGREFVATN